MLFFLILGLLLGALSVIFILQNIAMVTVVFFNWQLTSSLAVILLLALLAGVIITVLFTIPGAVKNRFVIASLRKQNKKLQDMIQTTSSGSPATVTKTTETTVVGGVNQ